MKNSAVLHTSTKEVIQHALLELLKEKDFAKISVAEIAKKANINRGTFYLHYKDKDELFEAVQSAILMDLEQYVLRTKIEFSLESPKRYKLLQYTGNLFTYIEQHMTVFQTLLLNPSSISFSNKLSHLIKQWFIYGECPHPWISLRENIPNNYLATMAATSLVSCLVEWLACETRETPDKIASFYVEIATANRN
ncbi:TetR/AcrR family transcriptional regulator [Kurthia populi]|uniref:TetR/AcrR family transcriptional regulator n=1 Tax=Kurthia populi TaxID=1562132 RepID=A0ABW5XY40_9BACL|nr:TetR/AcrR family transcriptional regulator [Candidatus Kurthia intestinigallinarum]